MVYVVADLHAYQEKWLEQIHPVLRQGDTVIVAGDFGFGFWNGRFFSEETFYDWIAEQPYSVLVVDGNHERFDKLAAYPACEAYGTKAQKIRDNIYHLCRGEIYSIGGNKVFVFGGAYSADRERRIQGVSWFPKEMPSEEEYLFASSNLERHGNQVDFIVTHTCPYETVKYLSTFREYGVQCVPEERPIQAFLDWVAQAVSYREWFFGHFHLDRELWRNQTAVFNCMRELETGKIVRQWKTYERF